MNDEKFSNTSLEPLGYIDGLAIRPCVKSGFCCTKAPCAFGQWNEDRTACKYLQLGNEMGQRDCGRYEWIKENVPDWDIYPGFGSGCCMPLFNEMRRVVIENILKK